jgi:hypothetical protein
MPIPERCRSLAPAPPTSGRPARAARAARGQCCGWKSHVRAARGQCRDGKSHDCAARGQCCGWKSHARAARGQCRGWKNHARVARGQCRGRKSHARATRGQDRIRRWREPHPAARAPILDRGAGSRLGRSRGERRGAGRLPVDRSAEPLHRLPAPAAEPSRAGTRRAGLSAPAGARLPAGAGGRTPPPAARQSQAVAGLAAALEQARPALRSWSMSGNGRRPPPAIFRL